MAVNNHSDVEPFVLTGIGSRTNWRGNRTLSVGNVSGGMGGLSASDSVGPLEGTPPPGSRFSTHK